MYEFYASVEILTFCCCCGMSLRDLEEKGELDH